MRELPELKGIIIAKNKAIDTLNETIVELECKLSNSKYRQFFDY